MLTLWHGTLSVLRRVVSLIPSDVDACRVADFLQEITSPLDQQKYWADPDTKPFTFITVQMFEDAYKRTEEWRQVEQELQRPFEKRDGGDAALARTP